MLYNRAVMMDRGIIPQQTYGDIERQRAEALYRADMANQAGVPYEVYICNGDPVCMQRMYMQQQYINSMNNYSNALQNQRVHIDGNIHHYGNINLRGY